MALLEPLYRKFRASSDKLIASFTNKEAGIIEEYLSKSIEIMMERTKELKDR